MPKHEIGRQVFVVLLAAIAAFTLIALVFLGAKDVIFYMIDAIKGAPLPTAMEGVTS